MEQNEFEQMWDNFINGISVVRGDIEHVAILITTLISVMREQEELEEAFDYLELRVTPTTIGICRVPLPTDDDQTTDTNLNG